MSMFLTDEEIRELTGLQRPSAQARALKAMGIEHRIRPDRSVVVLRAAVEAVLGVAPKSSPAVREPRLRLRNEPQLILKPGVRPCRDDDGRRRKMSK